MSENTRIAKNTGLLYLRMVFSMAVGLYTSRMILDVLGINDYGIYNVVGGVVAMFSFLNSGMVAASQRFISFELGKGDVQKLKKVFCTSVTIHIAISLIIFLISEIFGIWFLNNRLNIPTDRLFAANCVLQCSIVSFMLTVVSVPYNACIVAHERMDAFAYISIFEVLLKLVIVLMLFVVPFDKLIVYSLLLLIVSFVIRVTYGVYCKKHFEECSYRFQFEKKQFMEMFAFAGWSLVGNIGFSFKDQGSNMILNIFCGTAINAARGLAIQVNGVVSGFSSSLMMAINPQITKSYACGDIPRSIELVYAGCRYSFYLLAIIAVPLIVNMDFVLGLWLKEIPPYTSIFLKLALVASMINAMAQPLVTAMQATGKIKEFQICICLVMLLDLPITYTLMKLGFEPYYAMLSSIFVVLIGLIARIILLKRLVFQYSIKNFILRIFLCNVLILIPIYMLCLYLKSLFVVTALTTVASLIITLIIVAVVFFVVGLNVTERRGLIQKMKSK